MKKWLNVARNQRFTMNLFMYLNMKSTLIYLTIKSFSGDRSRVNQPAHVKLHIQTEKNHSFLWSAD
jgi:hypothetical protein